MEKLNKTSISIIGFGRFGKVLYRMIRTSKKLSNYTVIVYDPFISTKEQKVYSGDKKLHFIKSLPEVYKSLTVFYSVPISKFQKVINSHKRYITNNTIIDVLSVKSYPQEILENELKSKSCNIILSHPMFGPDSSKDGFGGLKIVLHKERCKNEIYKFWKGVFKELKLVIIEISPSKHDNLAANSQGITHFVGRMLEEMKYSPTIIDTKGAQKLNEIKEQTCNDSWELFESLQKYNPYTKEMRINIGRAYNKVYKKLLPEFSNSNHIKIGIQGAPGSFNEEAVKLFISRNTDKSQADISEENLEKLNKVYKYSNFQIKYLYTTEKVLKALHRGDIDLGQFAISNILGGLVRESINSMTRYNFTVVKEFQMLIKHNLMKRNDVELQDITTLIAHPQVLKQCQKTLYDKYTNYNLISGENDLIDTAAAAKAIFEGKLPRTYAILGCKEIANLYDFDILAENLQDRQDNFTTFLVVSR